MTDNDIRYISRGLSNVIYRENIQATKELVELLSKVVEDGRLRTLDDYIQVYDNLCFTYKTYDDLVESEVRLREYGLSKEECESEIGKTIFQLPCGWWVQLCRWW